MTVKDRVRELIKARMTVVPMVPINSPVPPGEVAMGIKAMMVVRVEARRGINRWLALPPPVSSPPVSPKPRSKTR